MISSTKGTRTIGNSHAKKVFHQHLTPLARINSKWIVVLHIKQKTVILLEENTGLGQDFLNKTSQTQPMKEINIQTPSK